MQFLYKWQVQLVNNVDSRTSFLKLKEADKLAV